jgi:cupin 2 domain-containing protein
LIDLADALGAARAATRASPARGRDGVGNVSCRQLHAAPTLAHATRVDVVSCCAMTVPQNLLADVPSQLQDELTQSLVTSPSVRIERIVSTGHTSPPGFWYDQQTHEWVLLLSGRARLRFEEGQRTIEMAPGSCMTIPAHTRHRVEWTDPSGPTVWVAVHYL